MHDLVELLLNRGPLADLADDLRGLHEAYCEHVCKRRIESGEDVGHTPRCKGLCARYGLAMGMWHLPLQEKTHGHGG